MYTLLKELQLFVINISNKSTDYYICAIHYFHQVTCFAKRNHMTITCLHNWKVHLHTICTLVLHGISVHGGCRRFSSELRPCMNSLFTQIYTKCIYMKLLFHPHSLSLSSSLQSLSLLSFWLSSKSLSLNHRWESSSNNMKAGVCSVRFNRVDKNSSFFCYTTRKRFGDTCLVFCLVITFPFV